MNVQIISCGSMTWERPGKNSRNTCYFNTTSFSRWNRYTRKGRVRFNKNQRKMIESFENIAGSVFYSPGIERFRGETRLLLHPRITDPQARIDAYLVCVTSAEFGRITFSDDWRTSDVYIIASSLTPHDGRQETLLLMGPKGLIRTSDGVWALDLREANDKEGVRDLPCLTKLQIRA